MPSDGDAAFAAGTAAGTDAVASLDDVQVAADCGTGGSNQRAGEVCSAVLGIVAAETPAGA